MKVEPGHRKMIRHWDEPGHAHELTFSCYERWPLLNRDDFKRVLSGSVNAACEGHDFDLVSFVFMPEHVHLIVLPRTFDATISQLLYAIKRPFSFRLKQLLIEEGNPLLHKLTIRDRPGKMTFRFWQEGPGYDRNLMKRDAMVAAIEYIHLNPVRRELCNHPADWKWSSFNHYDKPSQPPAPDLPTVHGIYF